MRLSYAGEQGSKFGYLTQRDELFSDRHFIYAGKFRRYHGESLIARLTDLKTIWLNVRDFFYVLRGFAQAVRMLRKTRPDAIFIKGGFVGVPVGLAAALLKIPFITHDSDTTPGLANRIIARWARLHATGMPAELYPYKKAKTAFVGIPVPEEFRHASKKDTQQAKKQLGMPLQAQLLVVTGGSQGSIRINKTVRAIVHELLEQHQNLHIVHHVGVGNESIYSGYMHERLHIEPFIEAFAGVITAADVVVTRGGANSLAELGVVGKPAIVIPSPFLAGGHQLKNAKYLSERAAIIELDEDDLQDNPQLLKEAVSDLLNDSSKAHELAKNINNATKHDAAKEIAKLLLS